MSEYDKMINSQIYNANYDEELRELRIRASNLCLEFNSIRLDDINVQKRIIKDLQMKTKERFTFEAPFYCDYGFNVKLGENFYSNRNLILLDAAEITFGNNVFIGPSCTFTTAGHPLDVKRRNEGLKYAYPINIGDNVWIGANVTVNPGVSIGSNSVIGSGSVVTKNIPNNSLAYGNPCKWIREINKEDEEINYDK